MNIKEIETSTFELIEKIMELQIEEKIVALNYVRQKLHEVSPFKNEPVDYVEWVKSEIVAANDYNPNVVAPPEMELLRISIISDGYTQPIVTFPENGQRTVIDGFHRNRVGKECKDVRQRVYGYLPTVRIKEQQENRSKRMASTIRHNRARGKHTVEGMSDLVIELKRRNWTDQRICRELGMEADEVLRLCQISGLEELFSDQEFSRAWDIEGEVDEKDVAAILDESNGKKQLSLVRTVNTSDPNRIFHEYDKWECYKAGFYNTIGPNGMTKKQCLKAYKEFLSDLPRFERALDIVTLEWKHSCEHYLTNVSMNRIAWLGQAAMCQATGVPSEFRAGYSLLTEEEQRAANELALKYLNKWLSSHERDTVTMEEAFSYDRQSDIY